MNNLVKVEIPAEKLQYSPKPFLTKGFMAVTIFGVLDVLKNYVPFLPLEFQLAATLVIFLATYWAMERYQYVDWRKLLDAHTVVPHEPPTDPSIGVMDVMKSELQTAELEAVEGEICPRCGENSSICERCEDFRR